MWDRWQHGESLHIGNGISLPYSGLAAGPVRHSSKVPDTLKGGPDLWGRRYAVSSICVNDGESF